jgi:hypothetical protein
MAVRTQHPQVVEPVVVAYPVDVVDLHGQRLPSPRVDTASAAPPFQQPGFDQSRF